jgi:uncharacterized protein
MLCDVEYNRLQAAFLAMARRADLSHEQNRWIALVQACQELRASEIRAKLNPAAHRHRAA